MGTVRALQPPGSSRSLQHTPLPPRPFLSRGGALVKQPELCCVSGTCKATAPEDRPRWLRGHPALGVLPSVTNLALCSGSVLWLIPQLPRQGSCWGGLITPKRRLKRTFNLNTGLGAVLSDRSRGKRVPSSLQGAQSIGVRAFCVLGVTAGGVCHCRLYCSDRTHRWAQLPPAGWAPKQLSCA